MSHFKFLRPTEASKILPGTVMFLPPREVIPKTAFIDPELLDGAFNHPIVILSCPTPTRHNSHVEFATMTSFHGTAIRKHAASKGVKTNTGALAAKRFGYLRVATESKPYAKDTLKFRHKKGMKRDFSYVNVKNSYKIELCALAQYGLREEVNAYRLTAQATKKLVDAVRLKEKKVKTKERRVKEQCTT